MDKRIIFNSNEIRILFFEKSFNSFNFKNWKELRKSFNISRSALESYRTGKLTLPGELYEKLSNLLDEKIKSFFADNIKFLDSGWGRIKAGKITYSTHKNIFEAGRNKAIGIRRLQVHKFDINLDLGLKLAYFLGLFIGDGFTNKYQGYYLVQFTGDKKEEQFYKSVVSDYCKDLFNLIPKIKDDKYANAIRVNIYSKNLFELITQRFNISAGAKSRTILIPREIIDSKPEIIKSFLRGLYDAEGCVFFDKRGKYLKPYPRIELHMCNLAFLKQVSIILTKFGIHNVVGTSKGNLRVTIWGFEEVKKFAKEIGFMNPKQLKKLRGFKRLIVC